MITTEAEARTKTCWRMLGLSNPPNCIGSRCMAWRWHVYAQDSDYPNMMAVFPPAKTIYVKSQTGYCGIAGSASDFTIIEPVDEIEASARSAAETPVA